MSAAVWALPSHIPPWVSKHKTAWSHGLRHLQILGAEARSRVPEEYVVQQPTSANPPTLFLVLAQMADQIAAAASDASLSSAMQEQQHFLKAGESSQQ